MVKVDHSYLKSVTQFWHGGVENEDRRHKTPNYENKDPKHENEKHELSCRNFLQHNT